MHIARNIKPYKLLTFIGNIINIERSTMQSQAKFLSKMAVRASMKFSSDII